MRSYTSKGKDPSFELDGVVFQPAELSLLDVGDLAEFADMDAESPEGITALNEFFKTILGGDYQRFREHCGKHHTDANTLMEVVTDVLKDVVGVPLEAPSPSAGGATSTGSTYKVVSPLGTVTELPLTPQRQAELAAAVRLAAG